MLNKRISTTILLLLFCLPMFSCGFDYKAESERLHLFQSSIAQAYTGLQPLVDAELIDTATVKRINTQIKPTLESGIHAWGSLVDLGRSIQLGQTKANMNDVTQKITDLVASLTSTLLQLLDILRAHGTKAMDAQHAVERALKIVQEGQAAAE